MCINVKSLCCIPKTNIILYVTILQLKKKKRKRLKKKRSSGEGQKGQGTQDFVPIQEQGSKIKITKTSTYSPAHTLVLRVSISLMPDMFRLLYTEMPRGVEMMKQTSALGRWQ